MVAECILETASSSAKSLTMHLANVGGDQPEKECVAKPLEEPILAKDQGEIIWHEENPQCLTHP
jgi:hypothetical protein